MRERILIAEDSATQRESLEALLAEQGFVVTAAADGEQALARAREQSFDLVITDVVMPGMDGFELCQRLKSELRGDCPAIMLLTGLSDATDIIRGLESGADNFLTKPYEAGQLISRIQFVIANRRLRQQARAEIGVVIHFLGRTFTITSERQQILDLLLTTYEDAVLQNRRLREREEELRVAKEELAEYAGTLEERLRGILHTVPDVLFSVDAHTERVSYMSPASARILGFTHDELLANPERWWNAVEPQDLPAAEAAWKRALTTGESQGCEYRVRHRDGSLRWVEVVLSPVRDAEGRAVRVDGVARDVTERKRADEMLRKTEEQLRFAQRLESIGTLAGGIAHDFNNLLGAARGQVDLTLLEAPDNSPLREHLERLAETLDRGRGLTRQLLAFGRRQRLEMRPLDLNDLVLGVTKMLERLLGENVQLVLRGADLAATTMADPGQIEQVVMNLCLNARDAMPQGGTLGLHTEVVAVDAAFAATRPDVEPGRYARLTVSDSGIGMEESVRSRIFEPFFTTKGPGHGTGLGLSVVFGIVKQHRGCVEVESAPGRGTSFHVYLPYREELPVVAAAATAKPAAGLPRGSETVLIAEDEEAIRRTSRLLLERLGYSVLTASDGEEALRILEQRGNEVHLVISDVSMPRMGGRQLRDAVRARFPQLRFLFATGYSTESFRGDGFDVGSEELITKPYTLAELAAAVRRALDANPAP